MDRFPALVSMGRGTKATLAAIGLVETSLFVLSIVARLPAALEREFGTDGAREIGLALILGPMLAAFAAHNVTRHQGLRDATIGLVPLGIVIGAVIVMYGGTASPLGGKSRVGPPMLPFGPGLASLPPGSTAPPHRRPPERPARKSRRKTHGTALAHAPATAPNRTSPATPVESTAPTRTSTPALAPASSGTTASNQSGGNRIDHTGANSTNIINANKTTKITKTNINRIETHNNNRQSGSGNTQNNQTTYTISNR